MAITKQIHTSYTVCSIYAWVIIVQVELQGAWFFRGGTT